MKVFYVQEIQTDTPKRYGETDGVLREGMWVRVDGQLIQAAFVFLDTPENHQKLDEYRKQHAAWRQSEPNIYELLNSMQRAK